MDPTPAVEYNEVDEIECSIGRNDAIYSLGNFSIIFKIELLINISQEVFIFFFVRNLYRRQRFNHNKLCMFFMII